MRTDPRAVLTRAAPAPDLTLAYGPLPDQVVDLRLPPADPEATVTAGPGRAGTAERSPVGPAGPARQAAPAGTGLGRPLVVVVHGGFWRTRYDRGHIGPLAAEIAAGGWPVAVIEYRRTGQHGGGWPGTFDDVAAAIRRAPAMVADALARRGRPPPPAGAIVLGHSAGGQLALWYAGVAPDGLRAVLALAPVADLAAAYQLDLDRGAVAALLGGGPADVPERYAEADPTSRPPLTVGAVVLHGRLDRQVPVDLSRRYVAAARSAGARVELRELADAEHFGLIDPLSAAWPSVLSALRGVT